MKQLRHFLEFTLFLFVYWFARVLPLRWGQNILGTLARFMGPHLPVQNVGLKNLSQALPQTTTHQKRDLLRQMWWHFGAVCAEYAKTYNFANMLQDIPSANIVGEDHLLRLQQQNQKAIFVSAHFGNWALATAYLYRFFPSLIMVHRPPNNAWVNAMFHYIQKPFSHIIVEKNRHAGLHILKLLKSGKSLVMLMDQKNNTGLSLKLFGHTAMTSPSAAQLAHITRSYIVPFYCVRTTDGSWQIVIEKPIDPPQNADVYADLTQSLNDRFESWIRKYPEQWFWVHKRFDKSFYK